MGNKKFLDEPRRHDSALILGCGPSINLLQPQHVENVDTFGVNNFYLHEWLAPDYLMTEIKVGHKYRAEFFNKTLREREKFFKNSAFLIPREDEHKMNRYIPDYLPCLEIPFNGYKPCRPYATYSLGRILSVVNGKRYKTIYLLGVDLYSSEYFWSGRKDLPDFIQVSNFERGFSLTTTHRTASEGVIDKLMPYIKRNNINVVNLSSKSLLAKEMPTHGLEILL